jgi:outer membrane protein assembly factor BamB
MKRNVLAGLSVCVVLVSLVGVVIGLPTRRSNSVVSANGVEIRVLDPAGPVRDVRRPDGTPVDGGGVEPTGGSRVGPESAPIGSGSGLAAVGLAGGSQLAGIEPALTSASTIDQMMVGGGYYGYDPNLGLVLMGAPSKFTMSDGTSWFSDSGTNNSPAIRLASVETVGTTIRYHFTPAASGIIFQADSTSYSPQLRSTAGTLTVVGPLVLEATSGSATGVLRGQATITANEDAYQRSYFVYYTSIVGSVVPFEIDCTLRDITFNSGTFSGGYFLYQCPGTVDFAHPVSVPAVQGLEIRGAPLMGSTHAVQFSAAALYGGGLSRDVSPRAVWSLTPASAGTIAAGLLTPAPLATGELPVVLHAQYVQDGVTVAADKAVTIRAAGGSETDGEWETFQADSRHSGHVPMLFDPPTFTFKWQRTIAAGRALNPVAAAGGKVFVTTQVYFTAGPALFALDGRDGETLWTKDFGSVFSVNPPAYAYGNVYVQTGDHASDTYLWAFNAGTGAQIFKSPHEAQWERYYAPTVVDDGVYVNGGYYGGMYAFDAFTGERRWFRSLDQYDQWTPAVDDVYAYAYVGGILSAVRRDTGAVDFTIRDPHFDWQGWSMGLAPALGGMDDALVVHDGRLLRFGLQSRTIVWEKERAFSGQPAVAGGVVYAIDNGALVAIDQATGADLWSWKPPSGNLGGPFIIAGSHAFVTTGGTTYAVELLSRSQVWSYPVGGGLALGDETLYIASPNGTVTAISMPEFTPSPVDGLEISGPDIVVEKSTAQYTARAHYADGRVRDRTGPSEWSVTGAPFASIDTKGVLTVGELMTPQLPVTVRARYTERGVTVEAETAVNLVIGVSLDEFITRNVNDAVGFKQDALDLLARAIDHQQAAQAVLLTERGGAVGAAADPDRVHALNRIVQALHWDEMAVATMTNGLEDLQQALRDLSASGGGAIRVPTTTKATVRPAP